MCCRILFRCFEGLLRCNSFGSGGYCEDDAESYTRESDGVIEDDWRESAGRADRSRGLTRFASRKSSGVRFHANFARCRSIWTDESVHSKQTGDSFLSGERGERMKRALRFREQPKEGPDSRRQSSPNAKRNADSPGKAEPKQKQPAEQSPKTMSSEAESKLKTKNNATGQPTVKPQKTPARPQCEKLKTHKTHDSPRVASPVKCEEVKTARKMMGPKNNGPKQNAKSTPIVGKLNKRR